MLLESTGAIPCYPLAQQLEHGRVLEPSFNIHIVSGTIQGAVLVPKAAGARAVQNPRGVGQRVQGVSAAEEAIMVV